MKNELYSASSCAVENHQGGLRLTMTFMHLGEFNDAHRSIRDNSLFKIDNRDPGQGGTCLGSTLAFTLDTAFAEAAAEDLGAFHIRREIAYVNGSRTKCDTIADAVKMALHHS